MHTSQKYIHFSDVILTRWLKKSSENIRKTKKSKNLQKFPRSLLEKCTREMSTMQWIWHTRRDPFTKLKNLEPVKAKASTG